MDKWLLVRLFLSEWSTQAHTRTCEPKNWRTGTVNFVFMLNTFNWLDSVWHQLPVFGRTNWIGIENVGRLWLNFKCQRLNGRVNLLEKKEKCLRDNLHLQWIGSRVKIAIGLNCNRKKMGKYNLNRRERERGRKESTCNLIECHTTFSIQKQKI